MKKFLVFALFLFAAFGLAACEGVSLEGDPDTIVVQFVPSNTVDSEMLTRVQSLNQLLIE